MEISENNLKLATGYALGNDTLFSSKDADFQNLFISYVTDNNSSTIRELVTMYYLKYKSYSNKHGADGIDEARNIEIEVKPKNFNQFDKKGIPAKYGGGGNFNDMTIDLLASKLNYNIVCSGFRQGRFVYVVEFPMMLIKSQLEKRILTVKLGKRVVCDFNHTHYNSDLLKVHYLNGDLAKDCLTKPHLDMLINKYDNNFKQLS